MTGKAGLGRLPRWAQGLLALLGLACLSVAGAAAYLAGRAPLPTGEGGPVEPDDPNAARPGANGAA